ncbi:MAG: HNH endonuclease [Sneathiella sp.]|nr:HNH endonuclease [Sneathiella sp.]
MNFWWVNQKQTYRHELKGGYLWSPKKGKNGRTIEFYENMYKVAKGDIVFSYTSGEIRAVSMAMSNGYSSPRPNEFGSTGEVWMLDGWRVDLDYTELSSPLAPKAHLLEISPLLPEKYSPIRHDGNGNQVYLCSISEELGRTLIDLIGSEAKAVLSHSNNSVFSSQNVEKALKQIQDDDALSETEKSSLVKSRVGQGLFRKRVAKIETECRVTHVSTIEHLIASHIKPWAVSSNDERLDGNNGLLLSPHIDHLFDKGFISFEDTGRLIVSSELAENLQKAWGVRQSKMHEFNDIQKKYLAFHRAHIFK